MDLKEIDQIEKSMAEEGYKANTAQKILGEEVTRILHGEEGVKSALVRKHGIPCLRPENH